MVAANPKNSRMAPARARSLTAAIPGRPVSSEQGRPERVLLLFEMSSIFLVAEAPWVRNDVLSATDDTRYEITVVGTLLRGWTR